MTSNNESLLSPYRVLDLTDEKGYLCGKILADLGADVIKIEPSDGDNGRNIGPFYHDIPDPEKSLYWFSFNMNKRGITLNIETADGKQIFESLVKTSDFIIESFPVGYMEQLGLGYSRLNEINPRIILTSISPFGQEGPYRDYLTSDLVAVAMGGIMYLSGDTDRPPIRNSFPQAYLNAGAEAAVASMIALYHRSITGEGQHVDISIQQSIVSSAGHSTAWWQTQHRVLHRAGPNRADSTVSDTYRISWPCKDGSLSFAIRGGPAGVTSNRGLFEWMHSEGMADDFINSIDWDSFDMATVTDDWFRQVNEPILRFFMTHTRDELLEGAVKRNIILLPVASPKDIIQSPQLEARNFWVPVAHPELDTNVTYPGNFIHASETPWKLYRRAPLIGEHNQDIYSEIGISNDEIVTLKQGGII
ncbi:CaiB/BaiF CoA transferase family protein [Chloroflexota bacterium]